MSITKDQDDFPIYRIMSIYEFYELYVKKNEIYSFVCSRRSQ